METSVTKQYLDKFMESLPDKVNEFIDYVRLTDPAATEDDFINAGKAFVEFGNAIIAKLS